jgi:hypothetical protein
MLILMDSGNGVAATRHPAPLLGTIALILLAVVFPLAIVGSTSNDGHDAWPGACAVMIIAGLRFSWVLASRERRLFEMVFWLFFYVFLGAAPMVQLRESYDPSTTPDIYHEFDWQAVVIVIVSELAIMVGSLLGKFKRPNVIVLETKAVHPSRTNLLAAASIAFAAFYVLRIGAAALFASRDQRSVETAVAFPDPTTSAMVVAAVTMGLLVSVIAQLQMRRESRTLGEKAPFLMLTVSTVLLFICANPISTPRYVFGTVVLAYLAALGIYGTQRRFRLASIGAIVGLVFLFPLLDVFRRSLDATLTFESPLQSFLSGDYDAFAQINNSAVYVERSGITWGNQALGVLLFWVPRNLWPAKPVDTGILLANSREYGFTNISAPLPAEMFVNGGWILLILGMVALGYVLRRWDARLERTLTRQRIPTILGCIVPFYLLIVLRGSLLQSMAYLAVILLAAWFVSQPVRNERGGAPGHKFFSSTTVRM